MALDIVDRAEDDDPTSETKIGRVNNVRQKKCFNSNKTGHIAKYCKPKIKSVYEQDGNIGGVFNVNKLKSKARKGQRTAEVTWILDSFCEQ
jgi:hypothetical protein